MNVNLSINLYPTKCNLCSGRVMYTSNADIYGKEYGSGKCYLCTSCRAYVGTHVPRPKEALGLLADRNMRKGKMMCHEIFDSKWKNKNKAKRKRNELYYWLARQLDISREDCHFGYFDITTLRKAYRILLQIKDEELQYNAGGRIINEVNKSEEEQNAIKEPISV